MAITLSIGGVDKSSVVSWESLQIEQQVTSQVDTAQFVITRGGSKNYTPSLGDAVTVDDGVTRIFGGTIVRIDDTIQNGLFTVLQITAVSHERTLDRYLVAKEISNKSARYIINTLFAEFVNRVTKVIDSGESNETWTTEDGTVAANTTAGQFIYQDQSRKFTATASSTATARRASSLDMTTFDDTSASITSDKIKLWVYVDTPANFASLRIRFVNDSGATYTNFYEYTYNSALSAGWNEIAIAKSAFSSTGSPDWATVAKRQYRVTASASGTVNVSIDDVRMVQATTYFPQTGVQNADAPTLGSVKFNYEQVSNCLKQIAEAVGCEWYVDPDRVLYFYEPASLAAPFSLTDSSQNFAWNTLKIAKDTTQIKNQIYVRGGEYQGSSTDYDQTADGVALNFRSPFRLKNISVQVNSVSKTVGVDNLDDPASYDCLYNYQEKTLKFKSATKPTAGHTVRMTGNPMIPVIIKKGDATSIASHGVYEHIVIDKSIITLQGGRDRATAELRAYRDSIVEGEFTTDTSGLRAGQTIAINITARNIAETYIIKSVVFRTKSPTEFYYDAKLVSTRTFGIIEYLISLIRNERKQIVINDNEVVDLVQEIAETIALSDAWTQASANAQAETITMGEVENDGLNQGTIFVVAPYTHSSFSDTKRAFILNGSLLG